MKHQIKVKVNGDIYQKTVNSWTTLNDFLRNHLNLTGTKFGCGTGNCGVCTVLVDEKIINSCLTLAVEINNSDILTVEGLAISGEKLHPIQKSFIKNGAIQCGFCTPGMEISALYLLKKNNNPTIKQIKNSISGNLCRCTGYNKIIKAILEASKITNNLIKG